MKISQSPQKGVTLFIAVLVCSMISLAVLSITSIASKQLLISGSIKMSQKAYYAADSAMECALYWDLHNYTNGGQSFFEDPTNSSRSFYCTADDGLNVGFGTPNTIQFLNDACLDPGASPTYTYRGDINGQCAVIEVSKFCTGSTQIITYGYNISCADLALGRPAVERAIKNTYQEEI